MIFIWRYLMSLSTLLSTFANNIFPIIILGGAGFALGKVLHVDSRGVGRIVFYVFSPVLIFLIFAPAMMDRTNASL